MTPIPRATVARALERIARVSLRRLPTPLCRLDDTAARLGLEALWVKRDGVSPGIYGGSKVRKLEYLLADPRWIRARSLIVVGAIGSQHVLATARCAKPRGWRVSAVLFPHAGAVDVDRTLDFVREFVDEIRVVSSRAGAAIEVARMTYRRRHDPCVVVPPGGTTPRAMVGLLRGALELADQFESANATPPDVLFMPLGSGGTGVGLLYGLAIAGLSTKVRLVAAVERWAAPEVRLQRLGRALVAFLRREAYDIAWPAFPAHRITIVRNQVGDGYGAPTHASLAATELFSAAGLALDPVYTAKAAASLIAEAPNLRGRSVLFWHSWDESRGCPVEARKVDTLAGASRVNLPRRRFIQIGAALSAAVASGGLYHWLAVGYQLPEKADARRRVLGRKRLTVLLTLARAILGPARAERMEAADLALAMDRAIAGLPSRVQRNLKLVIDALEHAGPATAGVAGRFTRLEADDQAHCLAAWERSEWLPLRAGFQAAKALAMLAYYRQAESFAEIRYGGPTLGADWSGPPSQRVYDALLGDA